MHVIASFTLSEKLELALAMLEQHGIEKDSIFAVPLNKPRDISSVKKMYQSDNRSTFDVIALFGAFFCALCTIYGFILAWGPVLWGLIGFLAGSVLGYLFKLIMKRIKKHKEPSAVKTEVFLMIECSEGKADMVEEILWHHQASGVARVGKEIDAPVI